jgi:2-polyprenyl-3-methyl-5-hydroxy-6-metoxy-1,4-benzoquinol methylase
LALKGYTVHATDLSPAAVTRAAQEATNFGVHLTIGVADLRTLDTQVEGLYDMVISMDNSLPHLLTDADLHQATRGIAAKTRSGGLFLASIRDYDQLLTDKPRSTTPQLYEDSSGRRVTFQIWDWQQDAPYYALNHFILKEQAGNWQTTHHATTYRALRRTELEAALTQASFVDLHWLMPETSHFYQPIIVAHKL